MQFRVALLMFRGNVMLTLSAWCTTKLELFRVCSHALRRMGGVAVTESVSMLSRSATAGATSAPRKCSASNLMVI